MKHKSASIQDILSGPVPIIPAVEESRTDEKVYGAMSYDNKTGGSLVVMGRKEFAQWKRYTRRTCFNACLPLGSHNSLKEF